MKIKTRITQFSMLATALVSFTFLPCLAQGGDEYSFKVHNTTKETIKKLLASEDGKKYGFFEIGSGIKAGEKATLVWDRSTNDGECEHFFKAVYSDGEESEPVKFDFCEEDLELEF